jgi:lysophospholipase L1-like esterase
MRISLNPKHKTAYLFYISFIIIVIIILFVVRLLHNKEVVYLALGDSIAAGISPVDYNKTVKSYPDFIAEELKKQGILAGYDNGYAIKGHTTLDLLNDIQKDIHIDTTDSKDLKGIRKSIADADIITLDIGANDILKKISYTSEQTDESTNITPIISLIQTNINQILLEIHKMNHNVKINLMGYYDMFPLLAGSEKGRFLSDFKALNQVLKQAAEDKGALFIPTDTLITEQNYKAFLPVAFNVHLNEAGNKELSNIFLKAMG